MAGNMEAKFELQSSTGYYCVTSKVRITQAATLSPDMCC